MADEMNRLEMLRDKNPGLDVYSVNDPEFKRYGNAITLDLSDFAAEAAKLDLPSEGSYYEPSVDSLEALPLFNTVRDELFGEMDIQIGDCRGYNSHLNALEWHKSSEINVAATDFVLLLAKLDDIEDGRLDSAKVKAFYAAKGEAVEVYADTLHFCPCQVSDGGFNCVVILPAGTNTNLENRPADRLLYRKNKWIFCHDDNGALKAKGVIPAIFGENHRINY